MIAPTSVCSRFNARPVTPLPKSNISLSFARVRPSILATPSPISRSVPTFCLAVSVLTPAICASISWIKVAIKCHIWFRHHSKALLERSQTGLDAAIIDIAANTDAHSTEQRRVFAERSGHARAIDFGQSGFYVGLQIRRQCFGALDSGGPPGLVELQQSHEMGQNSKVTAGLAFDELLHRLACAGFIEQTIDQA